MTSPDAVVSETPPVVLTCPAPTMTAACQTQAAVNAAFATWLATASGTGGSNGVLTNNNTGAPPACGGFRTVTFTYTTDTGTSSCQSTFTVELPPTAVLSCPAPTMTEACQTQASVNAQFATWLASASGMGGCNGVLTNNNTGAPPASGGSRTVTFTYTSSCSTASCTATFTVPTDSTPPVLMGVPDDANFQCLTDVPPPATVTATDNCDGAITPTFTETTMGSCPTIITRTWTARDAAGNSTTATQTIRVRDTIPPVLVGVPNDGTFQCLADVPAPPTVTATDNCDGAPPVTFTEMQSNPGSSCNNVITRTWRAVDSCQNSTTATQTIRVRDTTPPVLVGVPGDITVQCPADIPTVTATDNCDGTLPVTITDVQNNNTITRTWKAMDSCGNSTTATQTITVNLSGGNCLPKGPGELYPPASGVSDQKPGSVLIYNFYSSSASNPVLENTRINLTNLSEEESVAVHPFFVDGESCSVADNYICLTKSQTMTFLMSDIDPGVSGYIVAIATDKETGEPIAFNCLIGDAYIKLASGHAANLGAEAIAAQKDNPASLDAGAMTARLNFDNVSYNALPRVLAMTSLASPADVNSTLLVVNRIGGDLRTQADRAGAMFGIVYDQLENPYSFTFTGGCQLRQPLTSTGFPRTTPRLGSIIPAGAAGWMKFWATADVPLLGAMINFNPASATNANAFNQGHNLHKLTFTTTGSFTIPVFASNCQ